jgi:hypothetical protein
MPQTKPTLFNCIIKCICFSVLCCAFTASYIHTAEAAKKKKHTKHVKNAKKYIEIPASPVLSNIKDFGIKPFTYDPEIFGMQLGITDFDNAEKTIQKEGGQLTSYNYSEIKLNLNTMHKNEDKEDIIVNKEVFLIDFAGLPLDSLVKGRMGFFKNKMYFLYYEFETSLNFNQLEMQVVAKYGKPHRVGGFPDRFLEWRFLNSTLTLKDNFLGNDRMLFTHTKLLKEVNDSNVKLIKEEKSLAYKQQRAF